MDYLTIDKELIPYRFDITIANETFTFEFHYNSEGDFFTCDLYRGESLLYAGEKINYNRYLFGAFLDEDNQIVIRDGFPKALLIPYDVSGQATRVGWDELGGSVLIYVITEGDIDE